MNVLVHNYRRFDLLQRTRWFQIIASVIVLLACGGFFGSLIYKSYSLDRQRQTLYTALHNQNLERRDEHAVSLRENGAVTVNGRTYRTFQFARTPQDMFDEQGNIAALPILVNDLLRDQVPRWAPDWLLSQPNTTWLLAGVFSAWALLIVWMNITVPFILTLLATAIPVGISWFLGSRGWFDGYQGAILAFSGIGLLTFTYVLLTRTALLLFERPNQILAVAHTVIKEASRSKLSLLFIVLLLITLPLLPIFLDPEAPLRYRIQTFISRSVGFTFVIAAIMTLLLSCATVAFEIRDKQIWHLVTKPLSRWNYLVGKWLGVVTVNLILLLVAGVATFTFIQYLRTTPVAPGIEGYLDRVQVDSEVLVARAARKPTYQRMTQEQLRARIDQYVENDPELSQMDEVPLATRRRIADDLIKGFSAAQRTVPAMGERTYVFEGLQDARRANAAITLRYRFFILRSDEHENYPVGFVFNGDASTAHVRDYVPTMSHVVMVGPDMVREDGTMAVTIVNLYEPPPNQGYGFINFEEKDFEVLYKVANFEGNFFRAILIALIKLSFLSMLGIACSTFLSFPVACLLSFTIFIGGSLGPFLAMAIDIYEPMDAQFVDWSDLGAAVLWLWQSFITLLGKGLVFTLGAFGEFSPTQDLVEGKLIPWYRVVWGVLVLGGVWSGAALVIGYTVIRSRQLAIYSGEG